MIDLREEIAFMFDACAPEPWTVVEQHFKRRHSGGRPMVWLPAYRWSREHYRTVWAASDERCHGVLSNGPANRNKKNEHGSRPGDRCRLRAVVGSSYCTRHMN